jgi:hypothetical protein
MLLWLDACATALKSSEYSGCNLSLQINEMGARTTHYSQSAITVALAMFIGEQKQQRQEQTREGDQDRYRFQRIGNAFMARRLCVLEKYSGCNLSLQINEMGARTTHYSQSAITVALARRRSGPVPLPAHRQCFYGSTLVRPRSNPASASSPVRYRAAGKIQRLQPESAD